MSMCKYCGAVVQPLRFDRERGDDERGVEDGGTGVIIVAVTCRGDGCWWSVRRADGDDGRIGVEGIVL